MRMRNGFGREPVITSTRTIGPKPVHQYPAERPWRPAPINYEDRFNKPWWYQWVRPWQTWIRKQSQ